MYKYDKNTMHSLCWRARGSVGSNQCGPCCLGQRAQTASARGGPILLTGRPTSTLLQQAYGEMEMRRCGWWQRNHFKRTPCMTSIDIIACLSQYFSLFAYLCILQSIYLTIIYPFTQHALEQFFAPRQKILGSSSQSIGLGGKKECEQHAAAK